MKITRKMVLRNVVIDIFIHRHDFVHERRLRAKRPNAEMMSNNGRESLHVEDSGLNLRIVFVIAKGDSGGWSTTFYSLDQSPIGVTSTSLTLQGSDVKFSADVPPGLSFVGTLSADGSSMKGTWTGVHTLPLELQRATKEICVPLPDPNFWTQPDPARIPQILLRDMSGDIKSARILS